jgi:hypothetical protein
MPTIARTAASITGLLAVFLLVLYLAYGGSGGDRATSPTPTASAAVAASPTARPRVTASPSPAPKPVPAVLEGTQVYALEPGNLVQFPSDLAVILETGCWQCGEPPTGLRRMYKDTDGELRIEQLLSIEQLGLPPRIVEFSVGSREEPPVLTGMAIAADASEMLVSICVEGNCSSGPEMVPSEGRVAVFESTDGGVTWIEVGDDYPPTLTLHAYLASGVPFVKGVAVAALLSADGQQEFFRSPSMEPLAESSGRVPALSARGEIIWRQKGGSLTHSDGSTFLDLGDRALVQSVGQYTPSGLAPVQWSWQSGEVRAADRLFVSLIDRDGMIVVSYELHPADASLLTAIRYEDWSLAGTMLNPPLIGAPQSFSGLLPALLDLQTWSYNTIEEPFLQEGYDHQGDVVRAVQPGPLARVGGVDGSCLDIRHATSPDSSSITCVGNGALLTHDWRIGYGGKRWLHIILPGGREGWADTQFLEFSLQ